MQTIFLIHIKEKQIYFAVVLKVLLVKFIFHPDNTQKSTFIFYCMTTHELKELLKVSTVRSREAENNDDF